MALNLGDINFGLGVNTRPLNRSVKDVVNFGARVEEAARRTGKGAKQAAADLQKQERAAIQALRQTAKLNQALSNAGAPSKLFDQNAKAINRYTAQMTAGRVSSLQFQRVQAQFATHMDRNRRSLQQFTREAKGLTPVTERMRNLSSTATLALGPLSGLGARITALAGIANRSDLALAAMIGGITAGVVALGKMSQAAIQTELALDKVNARLQSLEGIPSRAAESFNELMQLADNAGGQFEVMSRGFTRLASAAQGTSLEGSGISQVFEDISYAAGQFRLDSLQLEGTLRAVEQMMSKGTVQAEELRGQLGDRIPGAFQVAARAMGVTTAELNKMLKAGEVLSEDFLPKFAAELRRSMGAEGVTQVDSLQASINRLQNATLRYNNALNTTFGISQLYEQSLVALTAGINLVTDNMDKLSTVAIIATGAVAGLAAPGIIKAVGMLVNILKSATTWMIAFNAATMANPFTAVAALLTRLGAAALGVVAAYKLVNNEVDQAAETYDNLISSVDSYIAAQNAAKNASTMRLASIRAEVADAISEVQMQLAEAQSILAETPETVRRGQGKGRESPNKAYEEQLDLIDKLKMRIEAYQKRLAELGKLQVEESERAAATLKEQERARISQHDAVIALVEALRGEAEATMKGEKALQAFQYRMERIGAVDKFAKELADLGDEVLTAAERIQLLKDYTEAYNKVQFAKAFTDMQEAASDAADEIDTLQQRVDAMKKGPRALQELEDQLDIEAKVAKFSKELIAADMAMQALQQDFGLQTALEQAEQTALSIATIIGQIASQQFSNIAGMFGQGIVGSITQGVSAGMEAYKQAIASIESAGSGGYSAIGPRTKKGNRAYGKYQVMDFNIGPWSQKYYGQMLNPQQFLKNPAAQEAVFEGEFSRLMQQYGGPVNAAKAWFGGPGALSNPGASDGFNTVSQYASKFTNALGGVGSWSMGVPANDIQVLSSSVNTFAKALEILKYEPFDYTKHVPQDIGLGGPSTEYLMTETSPEGNFWNIPSIWWDKDKNPIQMIGDQAWELAKKWEDLTGEMFPRFNTIDEAVKAAEKRSATGGASFSRLGTMPNAISGNTGNTGTTGYSPSANVQEMIDKYRELLVEQARLEKQGAQSEALKSTNEQLERVNAEIEAMRKGPAAVKALQDEFARTDAIQAFREELEKVGIAQDEINRRVSEFSQALEMRDQLENTKTAFMEFSEVVDTQLNSALDSTAMALANAVVAGESLHSLADIAQQVATQILASFLKLYILKPLFDDIFPGAFGDVGAGVGGVGSWGASGSGAGGGGFWGTLMSGLSNMMGALWSRQGNAFANGYVQNVKMFRKGGILSGPTLFSTSSGPAIGGEAADEGIVPLVRNSAGTLGVQVVGGNGGGNVYNFNFPPGTDARSFRKTEAQMTAMVNRVAARGARGQ